MEVGCRHVNSSLEAVWRTRGRIGWPRARREEALFRSIGMESMRPPDDLAMIIARQQFPQGMLGVREDLARASAEGHPLRAPTEVVSASPCSADAPAATDLCVECEKMSPSFTVVERAAICNPASMQVGL